MHTERVQVENIQYMLEDKLEKLMEDITKIIKLITLTPGTSNCYKPLITHHQHVQFLHDTCR